MLYPRIGIRPVIDGRWGGVRESLEAKTMGMDTVIVDDGWQTEDNNRGYSFWGDWEVAAKKFPDMAAHVKRVQDMGLKYLIWFSIPFLGKNTKAWEKFKDKIVCFDDFQNAAIFDIRFPEVREYLNWVLYENGVLNNVNTDDMKTRNIIHILLLAEEILIRFQAHGLKKFLMPMDMNRLPS